MYSLIVLWLGAIVVAWLAVGFRLGRSITVAVSVAYQNGPSPVVGTPGRRPNKTFSVLSWIASLGLLWVVSNLPALIHQSGEIWLVATIAAGIVGIVLGTICGPVWHSIRG